MKSEMFKSVDFWKSAVTTMPDNSFYELLRTVFGKIKTPFNKQQLLNDLEAFLLRENIQKTIASYIDQADAKIITAIALFGEPSVEQLENFFCDELSPAQLQDIIVNLEERFILYRYQVKKEINYFTLTRVTKNSNQPYNCLALNPVLKKILLPFIADTSELFPSVNVKKSSSAKEEKESRVIINDLILAGLFSFVLGRDPFYKPENVIRKQIITEAKTIFPGIDLEKLLGALSVLGLFYVDNDSLIPDRKRFEDFSQISAHERGEYCAASILVYTDLDSSSEILPPIYRGMIREKVDFIHSFLDSLEPGSLYPESSLKKIIEIIKAKTNVEINTEILFSVLEKTGLLVTTAAETKQLGAKMEKSANSKNPAITFDSSSSILVYPEIDFADVIKLAFAFSIKQTNPMSANSIARFEQDKDFAVRAFDNNISADEIIGLLDRLSGGKADNTMVWNFKEWEKRHGEVSLKRGLLLCLSEEQRYLAETRHLAALLAETLAPGLYLLKEDATDRAEAALKKAGIDIFAQRKEKRESSSFSTTQFISPTAQGFAIPLGGKQAFNSEKAQEKQSKFQSMLDKMQLSEQEKTELSSRIDRRLIICDTQLKDTSIRYEKLEARHLDYAGKQNIAKQAIAQSAPVEIIWSNKGKENRTFGIPSALEKAGNELILAIDDLRLPLAKISFVRRIKKSIFEK